MADDETCEPTLDILQPEVMSKADLVTLLRKGNLDISEDLTRDVLIDVYYKNIIPMPQRKYRLNRRGQMAAHHQVIMNRKRSYSKISSPNSSSTGVSTTRSSTKNDDSNSRFLCSFKLPQSTGDRLKPPPVNAERKIIRLKPASTSSSTTETTLSPKAGIIKLKTGNSSADSGSHLTIKLPKQALKSSSPSISSSTPTNGAQIEKTKTLETAAAVARAEADQNPNVVVKPTSSGGTLITITPSKSKPVTTRPKIIRLNRAQFVTPTSNTDATETSAQRSPGAEEMDTSTEVESGQLKQHQEEEDEVSHKKFMKIKWP